MTGTRRVRNNAARWRPGHSRSNVFLTPEYVLAPIRLAMGGSIGLDPCTESDNPTGAVRFYALPVDGLQEPWDAATIFVNPPYGDPKNAWIRRCLEIGQAGRSRIALLIPAHTDTAIGQAVLTGAEEITFVAGRLYFGGLRPNGREWRSTHPSMIATWGLDLSRSGLGITMRRDPDDASLLRAVS